MKMATRLTWQLFLAGIDRFRFSIKQADMCLVCIAFASWVLKSINPQSTDMWKTGKTQ